MKQKRMWLKNERKKAVDEDTEKKCVEKKFTLLRACTFTKHYIPLRRLKQRIYLYLIFNIVYDNAGFSSVGSALASQLQQAIAAMRIKIPL
jgi:hypothetical protein